MLHATTPYELGGEPFDFDTLYAVYLRGKAYLMQRDGGAAVTEFQKILDHRGRVTNCALGTLAHVQLGRAYAMAGDTVRAKLAFQDFLALWTGADINLAIAHEAAAEYNKLR